MKAIKPLQHGVFVDSGTESAFCIGWLARLNDVSTFGIKRARTEVRERPNEYVLRVRKSETEIHVVSIKYLAS
jgi:hypothetical protein